jgi:hypothetical protein
MDAARRYRAAKKGFDAEAQPRYKKQYFESMAEAKTDLLEAAASND